jgi:hypothetical protein
MFSIYPVLRKTADWLDNNEYNRNINNIEVIGIYNMNELDANFLWRGTVARKCWFRSAGRQRLRGFYFMISNRSRYYQKLRT